MREASKCSFVASLNCIVFCKQKHFYIEDKGLTDHYGVSRGRGQCLRSFQVISSLRACFSIKEKKQRWRVSSVTVTKNYVYLMGNMHIIGINSLLKIVHIYNGLFTNDIQFLRHFNSLPFIIFHQLGLPLHFFS